MLVNKFSFLLLSINSSLRKVFIASRFISLYPSGECFRYWGSIRAGTKNRRWLFFLAFFHITHCDMDVNIGRPLVYKRTWPHTFRTFEARVLVAQWLSLYGKSNAFTGMLRNNYPYMENRTLYFTGMLRNDYPYMENRTFYASVFCRQCFITA